MTENAVSSPSKYREIWQTLSRANIKPYIDKKMGLSYLAWANAWGALMEHYPDAYFDFGSEQYYTDNTCDVRVCVIIEGCCREMFLPVMDHRNKAVSNPNARQISDARMRCLVKCLALFGLGHSLYAGEDLPDDYNATPKQEPQAQDKSLYIYRQALQEAAKNGADEIAAFMKSVPPSINQQLKEEAKVLYNKASEKEEKVSDK